ncbi:MAG TPA: hypothetical protein VF251_05920 [Pyrinomonadaceae bacterium]
MSAESVKVTLNPVTVTVKSSGQKVAIPASRVQVVTAGRVGPSGPAGANADASFEWVKQSFALADPQQEFVLDFEPRTGSIFVYLNGLLEQFWSLVGATLTLDDIALEGDTVIVTYQKET